MKSHNLELLPAFYSYGNQGTCLEIRVPAWTFWFHSFSYDEDDFLIGNFATCSFLKLEPGTHVKAIQIFKEDQKSCISVEMFCEAQTIPTTLRSYHSKAPT